MDTERTVIIATNFVAVLLYFCLLVTAITFYTIAISNCPPHLSPNQCIFEQTNASFQFKVAVSLYRWIFLLFGITYLGLLLIASLFVADPAKSYNNNREARKMMISGTGLIFFTTLASIVILSRFEIHVALVLPVFGTFGSLNLLLWYYYTSAKLPGRATSST